MSDNTQMQRGADLRVVKASDTKTLKDALLAQSGAIERMAGKLMNPERMMSLALLAINKTPSLANATIHSIMQAVMDAARLGLEPDGVQGAIIPYKGSAAFQPMYRGLIQLAHREGTVDTIEAYSARKADKFVVVMGTSPAIIHEPNIIAEKSPVVAYYAVAHLNGRAQFEVMAPWEIEEIRKRSPSAGSGRSSPWDTDYDEMAKKTVIKRLLKKLPSSARLQDAVSHDNEIEMEPMAVDVASLPTEKGNARLTAAATKATTPPQTVTIEQPAPPAENVDADGFPIVDGANEPPPVDEPAPLSIVDALRDCPDVDTAIAPYTGEVKARMPEADALKAHAAMKARLLLLRKPNENPIDALKPDEKPRAIEALGLAAKAGVSWCAELLAKHEPST